MGQVINNLTQKQKKKSYQIIITFIKKNDTEYAFLHACMYV